MPSRPGGRLHEPMADDPPPFDAEALRRRFTLRAWPTTVLAAAVALLAAHAAQRALGVVDGPGLIEWGARSVAHQEELGQWWRLVTGLLLHGSWAHLLGNLVFLVLVGHGVEALLGPRGTAEVLVGSGLGGMAVAAAVVTTPAAGASPMVFGCFGAAVALGFRFDHVLPDSARLRYGFTLLFLLLGFSFVVLLGRGGATVPATDDTSHVAGALIGGLLAFVVRSPFDPPPRRRLDPVGPSLWGAIVLLALVLPSVHAVVGAFPVRLMDPARIGAAGVMAEIPRAWWGTEEGGRPTWRSPTGKARLSIWRYRGEGPTSHEGLRSLFRVELAVGGVPAREVRAPAEPEIVRPEGWWAFSAERTLPEGSTRVVRFVESSDESALIVEFEHPLAAWDAYAPVRRAVLGSVGTP